jgi:DnaK suppressor protein
MYFGFFRALTEGALDPILASPLGGAGHHVILLLHEQAMNKAQLKKFREQLEAKRDEIIKRAQQTLDQDMSLDVDDLPDEMDLASSEYLQSFTFRLRGREKVFLDKIQKALVKLDDGTFGVCDECGERISVKRLEARPETTLCIRCKEDQERVEKDFG